jgi:lysophospholipase L1-like esterase
MYRRICCTKFFVLIVILLTWSDVMAQPAGWDSISRPDVYAPRVALMKTFRHSKKDIVFLGNSITFWAEWEELLHNRHVKNRGIPGDNSYGVLERLDEVTGGRPAKVFLMIGINDLARNIPADVLLYNCKRIVRKIRAESPSTKIYVQSLLPVNESLNKLPNHTSKGVLVREINSGLEKMAAAERVTFINLYSHFTDTDG